MPDEEQPDTEHLFDQTNGLLGEVEESACPSELTERERRRQVSMAQGFGYISTDHN